MKTSIYFKAFIAIFILVNSMNTFSQGSKIAKELLVEKCREYVSDRIAHAKEAMQEAQEAANEESKSSAGDKYNTVRALMQIETDKHARQLIEAQKLSATLDLIHIEKKYEQVELGSLVYTNSGIYFNQCDGPPASSRRT